MSNSKIIVSPSTSSDQIGLVTGTPTAGKVPMDVAIVGGISVSNSGLVAGTDYDYIDVQQTSATVETFVFKLGGSGGSTVQTIAITYTDSTKANIDTVEWS